MAKKKTARKRGPRKPVDKPLTDEQMRRRIVKGLRGKLHDDEIGEKEIPESEPEITPQQVEEAVAAVEAQLEDQFPSPEQCKPLSHFGEKLNRGQYSKKKTPLTEEEKKRRRAERTARERKKRQAEALKKREQRFRKKMNSLPLTAPAAMELEWIRAHPRMGERDRGLIEPGARVILEITDLRNCPSRNAAQQLQHWINRTDEFYKFMIQEDKKRMTKEEESQVEETSPEIKRIDEFLLALTGAITPDHVEYPVQEEKIRLADTT